jgi:hypothetical protein
VLSQVGTARGRPVEGSAKRKRGAGSVGRRVSQVLCRGPCLGAYFTYCLDVAAAYLLMATSLTLPP